MHATEINIPLGEGRNKRWILEKTKCPYMAQKKKISVINAHFCLGPEPKVKLEPEPEPEYSAKQNFLPQNPNFCQPLKIANHWGHQTQFKKAA